MGLPGACILAPSSPLLPEPRSPHSPNFRGGRPPLASALLQVPPRRRSRWVSAPRGFVYLTCRGERDPVSRGSPAGAAQGTTSTFIASPAAPTPRGRRPTPERRFRFKSDAFASLQDYLSLLI